MMLDEQDADTFVVGVTHRFFNAELRRRRLALGLNQEECSVQIGLSPQRLGALEILRAFPNAEERQKIGAFFGVPSSVLFPEWIREWKHDIEAITTMHEITPLSLGVGAALPLLEGPDADDGVIQDQLKDVVPAILATLPTREREIIELRFGLADGERRTLLQVSERIGVCPDRVRQIEEKALRKLRHPSRSKKLRPFLDLDEHGAPARRKKFPKPFWERRKEAAQ